jgi:hypothetical protein
MDVLDEIRQGCRAVAERATLVRIDTSRLHAYATTELDLSLAVATAPVDDPSRLPVGTPEETAAMVVALDAVNFGSGWFPVLRKRDGLSGYFTIATAWREHVERSGAPTAAWLAAATASECAAIFGQDPSLLLESYGGSVGSFVAAAEGSAARLASSLRAAPMWDDTRRYGSLSVPFLKRAQITAVDLAAALGGSGLGRFDDLHRLTIFADNLVPHVLRLDGVLVLDESLAARIDAGELLEEGSPEEVELRACAVDAVEQMVAVLGGRVTAADLDNLLWNRGQGAAYKAVPRPRCRTTSY